MCLEEEEEGCAYVLWSHGPDGGHDVDDGNERRPADSPDVDGQASPSEMEWPTLKLAIQHFANDRDAVGPIESDGRQIEDGGNGGVRSQTDQVDADTSGREEPDRVNRGVGLFVDLVPDTRQGQHFVAGVGPNCSGTGLDGRHGCEVEDEAGGHGKENASVSPNDVVEDLSYGLVNNIAEGVSYAAAAIGQYDSEEPTSYPGEAEREGNGPRGFDFRVLDLFGDMSSRVIISHGPRG